MWQDLLLAGASGSLTAVTVWWILARNISQDTQQLSRRIRQISRGPGATLNQQLELSSRKTRYSAVPLVREFLNTSALAERMLILLEQAGSQLSVGSFLLLHGCTALTAWTILSFFHVPSMVASVFALCAGIVPTLTMFSKRRKRFAQITGQLPDAIRLMSSAMRAGLGLEAGLNIVAQELQNPIKEEFKKLLNEWRLYGDMNEAFLHLARRIPSPDMRLFVASACLHRDVGGNFVEVLEQLEETIRQRFQLYRELKMLTAESRMSGWILGGLPLAVAGGLFILNPGYVQLLLDREIGRLMLWASIGLQLVGLVIIQWLTHPKIR